MDFDNGKPIYLQIVELFYENILLRKWQEAERIPSVREIAVMVEVNPNTAMRAFTHLQEQDVIHNKRGIGYFVSENGYDKVLDIKRKEFKEEMLPNIFKKMKLLEVTFEDVTTSYNAYLKTNEDEKK
jgi:DNA-binding transcriptional regulator YhcF (GntR family)